MLRYVFNLQLPNSSSIGSIVFCSQMDVFGQKNLTREKKKVAATKINIIRSKNISDEKNIANWQIYFNCSECVNGFLPMKY